MVTVAEILAHPDWGPQARAMLDMGASETQIIQLFGLHVERAAEGVEFAPHIVVGSGVEGEQETVYRAPVPVVDVVGYLYPEEEEESLYAPAGSSVRNGGEVEMAMAGLIAAVPYIVTALKALGYMVFAEEIVEFITGSTGLTTVDDVIQQFIAQKTAGLIPGDATALGLGMDPAEYKVGQTRAGWQIKNVTKYSYGKAETAKVWYKPYDDKSKSKVGSSMNFPEKCAYYQGIRVQTVTGRQAKYRAYRRGFDDGAVEQQEAERSAEGGTTGLVQYSRSRGRRRR